MISKAIEDIFTNNKIKIYETFPNDVMRRFNIINRYDAIKNLHFPKSITDLNKSIKRLKYEEAIELQLRLQKVF